jgi:hypothetical protein
MHYSDCITRQGVGQMGMGTMEMSQTGMMGGMGMQFSSGDYALIGDISEAIIREVHAYNFYQGLIQMVPDEEDRHRPCEIDL